MQLWQFLAPIQARVHPLVYFRHGQCCGPARRSFHLNWPNLVASASPPPPLTPTDVVCWLSSVRVAVNSVAVVRCTWQFAGLQQWPVGTLIDKPCLRLVGLSSIVIRLFTSLAILHALVAGQATMFAFVCANWLIFYKLTWLLNKFALTEEKATAASADRKLTVQHLSSKCCPSADKVHYGPYSYRVAGTGALPMTITAAIYANLRTQALRPFGLSFLTALNGFNWSYNFYTICTGSKLRDTTWLLSSE